MPGLPDDPETLVPQVLSAEDAREYERRTVAVLHRAMVGGQGGLVEVERVELRGSRPDTLVVFRYRHRGKYVGRHSDVVAGPRAEIARFWEFAIDADDPWSQGMMQPPSILASAIGSAFEAAELELVDPETLVEIGRPPKIFPRLYDLPHQ